jgi:hypothetical protein
LIGPDGKVISWQLPHAQMSEVIGKALGQGEK